MRSTEKSTVVFQEPSAPPTGEFETFFSYNPDTPQKLLIPTITTTSKRFWPKPKNTGSKIRKLSGQNKVSTEKSTETE
jgi:hypothetical protein